MDETQPWPDRPEMRIADADREQAAERLGFALSEGRLDMVEYERRLEQAMSAKTMSELEPLTADLPLSKEEQRRAEAARKAEQQKKERRAFLDEWKTWIGAALIMNGIWGFMSIQSGELKNYWPGWVLGIWAILLIAGIFWKDEKGAGKSGKNRKNH